jgi:hypothetical protein
MVGGTTSYSPEMRSDCYSPRGGQTVWRKGIVTGPLEARKREGLEGWERQYFTRWNDVGEGEKDVRRTGAKRL